MISQKLYLFCCLWLSFLRFFYFLNFFDCTNLFLNRILNSRFYMLTLFLFLYYHLFRLLILQNFSCEVSRYVELILRLLIMLNALHVFGLPLFLILCELHSSFPFFFSFSSSPSLLLLLSTIVPLSRHDTVTSIIFATSRIQSVCPRKWRPMKRNKVIRHFRYRVALIMKIRRNPRIHLSWPYNPMSMVVSPRNAKWKETVISRKSHFELHEINFIEIRRPFFIGVPGRWTDSFFLLNRTWKIKWGWIKKYFLEGYFPFQVLKVPEWSIDSSRAFDFSCF